MLKSHINFLFEKSLSFSIQNKEIKEKTDMKKMLSIMITLWPPLIQNFLIGKNLFFFSKYKNIQKLMMKKFQRVLRTKEYILKKCLLTKMKQNLSGNLEGQLFQVEVRQSIMSGKLSTRIKPSYQN